MEQIKLNLYKSIRSFSLFLCAFALLVSCTQKTTTSEEEGEEEHSESLELSEAQMVAVGITLGKIEVKNLKSVVKANGQLEVPPQNNAEVHPLIGGLVRKIFVLEGSYVRKGQTLVTIENPEFIQVQQDYLASKSALSFAEKEFTRQKELMAAKAGTGKVYQQAEANYFSELSRSRTLQRQLGQMGISVNALNRGAVITQVSVPSPISGVVGHIEVTTGSYAETTQALMTITDNTLIHCDLLVYEKDLFKVKPGQSVEFILTNQNNQLITGEIYGINKTFENDSKAVIAHARIDNRSNRNLIPGMYVSASINVGTQTTTVVPIDAVITAQGKSYIFVVDGSPEKEGIHKDKKTKAKEENSSEAGELEKPAGKHYRFKQVEISTGISDLGYIEITTLTEIPKNATIVNKGAFYLQSKAAGGGEDEH